MLVLLVVSDFDLVFEDSVSNETFCDLPDGWLAVLLSFVFFFCDEWGLGVLRLPFRFDMADPGVLILGFIIEVRVHCLSSRGEFLRSVGESVASLFCAGAIGACCRLFRNFSWFVVVVATSGGIYFTCMVIIVE